MTPTARMTALFSLLATLIASVALWRCDAAPQLAAEMQVLRAELAQLQSGRGMAPASNDAWLQLSTEVRTLRSELASVRRELAALRAQPLAAGGTASAMTGQPEVPAPSQELSARLDQALQNEPQTLEARRLANQLGAAITRVLPQRASLQQIVCGTSLCRAEVYYPSAEQLQGFIETQLDGADGGLWEGPVMVHTPVNPTALPGAVQATLYLGRTAGSFETASMN